MGWESNPTSRKNDLVIQNLNGELLIYDLRIGKAYCLNETSAGVWNLCDGRSSVAEITEKLSEKFKTPIAEDLVYFAVDQLKKENLLENGRKIKTNFEGLTRREVIRRVGFASLIALPVISSLVAPHAAAAASTCGCINPGSCFTQTTCPSTVNCNGSGRCAP